MHNRLFIVSIITIVLLSCGCDFNGASKSPAKKVEKLNSPDNRYSFYRYIIGGSMAFTSESVRMTILDTSEDFDYTTTDYFVTEGAPVVLGWKDPHTLKMIVVNFGERTNSEPYKHETKKWKDFTIEIDYYHMFSTSGGTPFRFDSCRIQDDTITFSNKKESKSFIKGKVEMSYNSHMLDIREIEAVLDSTGKKGGEKGKVLVYSTDWDLIPTKEFDFTKLIASGVLIEKKL